MARRLLVGKHIKSTAVVTTNPCVRESKRRDLSLFVQVLFATFTVFFSATARTHVG